MVYIKGVILVFRIFKSLVIEGEWIVMEIKCMVMMLGNMVKYDDVVILLCLVVLLWYIEFVLGKVGILYCMIGGYKFYDWKEIKILLDYLCVVY